MSFPKPAMRLRRPPAWALRLLLLLLAAWPALAWATSSLGFDGGGYTIELEVGDDTAPTIARVRFHAPGDAAGTPLQPGRVRVEAFDPARRILTLAHAGDPQSHVPAFLLRVRGERAVLEIDRRRIESDFAWTP